MLCRHGIPVAAFVSSPYRPIGRRRLIIRGRCRYIAMQEAPDGKTVERRKHNIDEQYGAGHSK